MGPLHREHQSGSSQYLGKGFSSLKRIKSEQDEDLGGRIRNLCPEVYARRFLGGKWHISTSTAVPFLPGICVQPYILCIPWSRSHIRPGNSHHPRRQFALRSLSSPSSNSTSNVRTIFFPPSTAFTSVYTPVALLLSIPLYSCTQTADRNHSGRSLAGARPVARAP